MAHWLKLGVVYTSIRMGVVLTSTNREKLNRENYIWLYCRQYRKNLDLRKFPAIRYIGCHGITTTSACIGMCQQSS